MEGAMKRNTMVKWLHHFKKEKVEFCEESFLHTICTCFESYKRQKSKIAQKNKFHQNVLKWKGNGTLKMSELNAKLHRYKCWSWSKHGCHPKTEKLLWIMHRIEDKNFNNNSHKIVIEKEQKLSW